MVAYRESIDMSTTRRFSVSTFTLIEYCTLSCELAARFSELDGPAMEKSFLPS